ncbi:MAG: NADAR family protein [Planctomycetes bacterium]|nr:NADAR family protein [Planctomycetota bacterium]
MNEPTVIRFYFCREEHGYLSNLARYPIEIDGRIWPTNEHYYQAQKFTDPQYAQEIFAARSATKAARLGQRRPDLVRPDWATLKEIVMLRALRAKFSQHAELALRLTATGHARLVEHTHLDSYWADGGDGSGLNRLGALLEQVREELRAAPTQPRQSSSSV